MTRKALTLLLILIVVVLAVAGWVYYSFFIEKSLRVISPNGKEVWQTNLTYKIRWKAKKIDKVGIMLIKESTKETKWIAKDISGLDGVYNWNIFVWEEPRDDYRIVVFEYPWGQEKLSDYSDDIFTIVGPKFASCDTLSVQKEWPFLPSDYPDLRKLFLTEKSWNGNLEGLEGADKKCQEEAEIKGLTGNWKAFLGADQTLAVDRLNLSGIFVYAVPEATLPEGKTCHQLWGRNFEEFFQKFSDTLAINQEKFEDKFLRDEVASIWMGRITKDSKRDCTTMFLKFAAFSVSKNYSFTTTCQDWTTGEDAVAGFSEYSEGEIELFPKCYTPEGVRINAASLAGLATGIAGEEKSEYFSPFLGRPCNQIHKLLCIQQ